MTDEYLHSAEFLDPGIAPHWAGFGPVLADARTGLNPAGGVVVDLGAGSGLGTLVIADAVLGGEIVAVEPASGPRSVLLARVNTEARPREAVTVVPEPFPAARLPERIGAVVVMNVLGHVTPADRRGLWWLLAERLGEGGRAVLNLLPPAEPVAVPDRVMSSVRIGRRRYEGAGRAVRNRACHVAQPVPDPRGRAARRRADRALRLVGAR
ncbi:hypothetical protein SAMN05421810_101793 [Amycolatopsis arida]|uniref:Methyltransferase domain-containing protein n=1 Tax=Amycolatopsis arida TaxID=587909 RepID=A0A1I5M4V3_9PSEU|nr:class I SAM-dependent methyltransferase [Amycolatopsis arida]TDX93968.1 hypothetical protein CLV69_104425 [Amycolatopsis arida]SFP04523.1 hypothetical protein SAMN05421810_101793 [Amycolatopsis arida]